MKRRKWISACLVVALLLTMWHPRAVRAEETKKAEYIGEGYSVIMQITGEWENGFNAEVTVKNTGIETLDNWAYAFYMPHEIINIWNGVIFSKEENTYIVKNAGSNQDIGVNASVSFGFTASKEGEIIFPETFKSVTQKQLVSEADYGVELHVVNDWGSAFQGEINITNLAETVLEDWELSFSTAFDITDFYTAEILSKENGHYLIKNRGYNANIQAGDTLTLGFSGTPGNVDSGLENIELRQVVVTGSAIDGVVEGEKEKDTDGDGLPDSYEKNYGTSIYAKDTDGDNLSDAIEIYYSLNPLISDLLNDYDEDGLTTESEFKYGTHIFLEDTDQDELSDLEEIEVYFTDPTMSDTDNDGLDDGTEIRMGFNPLIADSDGNGVADGKEKISQRMTVDFFDEEKKGILSVDLTMEATGEIERTTVIKNTYGSDILSSGVVGLIGVPVDITTQSEFEEATITFTYDENALGETKEDNLRVMWYDEANNQYVIFDEESVLDTENNTLSYTTSHFSTYLVVDRQAWYDVWNEAVTYGRTPSASYPTQYIDLCYLIDKSESMSDSYMNTVKDSIRHFIEAMYDGDRGAIVGFSSYATVYQDFTSEKSVLIDALERVYAKGGTSVEKGLVKALNLFPSSEEQIQSGIRNARVVLLLCDGDVFYTESTLNKAKTMGVKIYPVLIGSTYGKEKLQTIADTTGGKLYYAATAEEIREAIFGVQEDTVGEIDTTDTDGDGLYDIYETAGMILPNGSYVYTDPNNPDTDNDTIPDGEEMGILEEYDEQSIVKKFILALTGFDEDVYAEYFDYCSDPTKKDTDEDGYNDAVDAKPLRENEEVVYIFYEKGGDGFLENEAECRRDKYKKAGENVIVIGTKDKAHFIESWNNMGLDEEGKYLYTISDVYTIYHGNPEGFAVSHKEKDNGIDEKKEIEVERISSSDFRKIQNKEIDVLHLSSCNNGNIDWINSGSWGDIDFSQNIAISFLKKMDGIKRVIAWDGSAVYADLKLFQLEYSSSPGIWDSILGTGNFLAWSRAKNGYNRWSNGLITYYRDGEKIKMSATHKMEYSYLGDGSRQYTWHEIKEEIH